jgi:drug/metabolite transporter (DMT)-like permease
MLYFFIVLIAPFLYALSNYIDKILLEKYFKKSGVGVILLFSSLVSIFSVPFFLWADPTVLDVSYKNILVLCLSGILNIGVIWCYLLALKDDETSIVIVFYQLVPLFAYLLGYLILGESLTQIQLISMAIIILGTTIIAIEIDSENKFKLRKKTILPMIAASFFWALESVIFKAAAIQENVWRSLFWGNLMLLLVGTCIFIFIRSYRVNFLLALRNNSKAILSLNAFNELLYILANIIFAFSYMVAPVSIILLTNSFQPIFVFIIGLVLTIFAPKILVEKIQTKHIWQKIIAMCITGIGVYLLFMS